MHWKVSYFQELKEIGLLMSSWENFYFSSPETQGWILGFLVNVTTHLNPLKGTSQVVTNEFMCPSQAKHMGNSYDKEYCGLCSFDESGSRSNSYGLNYIPPKGTEFQKIFSDFKVYKDVLTFSFNQIKLSQLTLIMRTESFKWKFLNCINVFWKLNRSSRILEFYKCLCTVIFLIVKNHCAKILYMSRCAYVCEQLFSFLNKTAY